MTDTQAAPRRKQTSKHEDWLRAWDTCLERVPPSRCEQLIDVGVQRILDKQAELGPMAYSWSGGKDSQAIRAVAERAGVTECVLVICGELEFPEFLAWSTDHMPAHLTVEDTGQSYEWLSRNPHLVFPMDTPTANIWYHNVQHAGQNRYFRNMGLGGLLMGRRRQEGNYVGGRGAPGQWWYTTTGGTTRVSPIYDWTNDETLAVCRHMGLPLGPMYHWPRGFRVGTGAWPMRRWSETVVSKEGGPLAWRRRAMDQGWLETYTIDPGVVRQAAEWLPDASNWLRRHG